MSFESLFNRAACKGAKCEKSPPFLFGLQWAADTVGDRTHVIVAPSCRAQRAFNLFPLQLDAWSKLAEDIELQMQRNNLGVAQ